MLENLLGVLAMPHYRSITKNIEAFRLNIDPMPDWFYDLVTMNKAILHNFGKYTRDTPYATLDINGGIFNVVSGEYIIKDAEGRIYPCTVDVFEENYEVVS